MITNSQKLLALTLILVSFLGGCKKNKSTKYDKHTTVSKSKKSKRHSDRSAQALSLDADDMKSFALDDKISKHSSSTPATNNSNTLFSWENPNAEQSKSEFKTLYYEFDKDILARDQLANLNYDIQQGSTKIKQGKTIVIEGHACHSAGSRAYNLALSERRARNAAQSFAEHNIDPSSIKIAARGVEMPIVKHGNKQQQAPNRRDEVFAI